MNTISLDAAITLTEWSRRTWWRRLSEGEFTRVADDSRGRAMLAWIDVQSKLIISMDADDLAVLARADSGEAEAQNDIGQLLASSGKHEAGLYWVRQAAEQELPDAMQWLGRAYAAGQGVERDQYMALSWLAKAAAAGHVIATEQVKGLLP